MYFEVNMLSAFSISRIPRIEFGSGKRAMLPGYIKQFGNRVLLVKGKYFLHKSGLWDEMSDSLKSQGIQWETFICGDEPSPALVDRAVSTFSGSKIDVVVGIGGGSVLDAAKAIAGLLLDKHSVMDYLEGVGPELLYKGPSVPFIALPTTAGTGSEATKNSVLSVIDQKKGFKKSFRDEKLVAEYAIVDPDFLASCPQTLIAANGMDALTQLLESYVSLKANPITDALAVSGLNHIFNSLLSCYDNAGSKIKAHESLAYGSLLSGITLAQTGLGSVHGLASPLGAFYPVPHGEVCGTLLAPATEINIRTLRQRDPDSIALKKYADMGRLISKTPSLTDDKACQTLVETFTDWSAHLKMPRLSNYGVEVSHLMHIVKNVSGSSMKTNPVLLTDDEVREILIRRL